MTLLATFAGPVYSFSVIWLGYLLLTRASPATKSVGFALVVSSVPFARVLTPVLGGGDEIYGLTRLGIDRALAWPLALVVVLALAVPPVVKTHGLLGNRRRSLWIVGLLLGPFLAVGAVVLGLLQGWALKRGFLSDEGILGSPILVTAWFAVALASFAILARHVVTLLQATPSDDAPRSRPKRASD